MSQEITKKGTEPKSTVQDLIKHAMPEMIKLMPKHLNTERFYQLAIATINREPKLAKCDPLSFLSCLMKCATLGLEPSAVDGLGNVFILPYGTEATFILGYKGMLKLARNAGVQEIAAHIVCENDHFEIEFGTNPRIIHRPDVFNNRGSMKGVYLVAKWDDGKSQHTEFMSKAEIDEHMKLSPSVKSGKKSPWTTDYEEMARKTVIRRAFKMLPVSADALKAVDQDEQSGTSLRNDFIIEDMKDRRDDSDLAALQQPEETLVDPETGEMLDTDALIAACKHAVERGIDNKMLNDHLKDMFRVESVKLIPATQIPEALAEVERLVGGING